MKKKSFSVLLATIVAGSVMFSSCIGSFALSNKLLDWNRSIDSKFVNELVFIAFWIVPVYEISMLADIVVINSIEFWSGSNPVADAGTVKNVETDNGTYAIETKTDGYHIEKDGKSVDLVFDKADKSWSVEADGETQKLLRFEDNDKVVMFLPGGEEMTVSPDAAGVMAFRQIASNALFAAR